MSEVIRFLVEQYYDVQKLRTAGFNGIVAYAKVNMDKLQSQMKLETQPTHASQIRLENHSVYASQPETETHDVSASQENIETQSQPASQGKSETQILSASQKELETQPRAAPKPSIIAHLIVKGDIKVPKDVGELVWYHNSLYETERQLAKKLDGWSSHHPLRINFLSRITGIGPILSSALIAWLTPISRFETVSKLWAYCGLSSEHWQNTCSAKKPHHFFSTSQYATCPVKVGKKRVPCGANIAKAEHVKAPMHRKHGWLMMVNTRMRTLMWKVAASFEKQKPEKSRYRRVYAKKKQYYLSRPDLAEAIRKDEEKKTKGAKLHVRSMTMRYTSKQFLEDLWLFWRKMEGLPVTEPYAYRIPGHMGVEPWEPDKQ